MRLLVVIALASASMCTPAPAPTPPPAPVATDASVDAAGGESGTMPTAAAASSCSSAYSHLKGTLVCPPKEGFAWQTAVCPKLTAKVVKCIATAKACDVARNCGGN